LSRLTQILEISLQTVVHEQLIFERFNSPTGLDNEQPKTEAEESDDESTTEKKRLTNLAQKIDGEITAAIEGALEAPKHLALAVHDAWTTPPHEDFSPMTSWSCKNSFTEALKTLDPIPMQRATLSWPHSSPFVARRALSKIWICRFFGGGRTSIRVLRS
jgi:hypothetical protein